MNIKQQLTGKHQQAILNNTDISKPGFEQPYAALSHTNISIEFAVEHMKGFSKWVACQGWDYIGKEIWTNRNTEEVTTNELINLYFESLTTTP